MANAGAEVNLLFGILALQVDFINRDQLIEGMQAWALDKSRSLGEILVAHGALQPDQREPIELLVAAHLNGHQRDVQQRLRALTASFSVPPELSQIQDDELGHTLSHLSSPPTSGSGDFIAVAPSVGDKHFGRSSSDSSRFERIAFHDEGGLGTVWLAQDRELDRRVAIKEMKERFADDPPSRKRFEMEAEITGALEHPGVVPVYGYGTYEDGRPFYAMRFIRGGSLQEMIRAFHQKDWSKEHGAARTLELRRLLSRFLDVCNTIYYAHRRGVLHRDIKPSNVMLGDYGETLVVDWGLAKTMGHTAGVGESSLPAESTLLPRAGSSVIATVLGKAIGSPPYMSPEQARGELDQLGPATDIYSLGATLYTLLTDRQPVEGNTTDEVLRKVRVGEWVTPRQLKADVPRPLEAICLKAMALKPEDRYSSVRRLACDVENYLADEPVSARRESLADRLGRFGRRHRILLTTAAVSLGLISLISTMAAFAVNYQRQQAEQLAERNEALATAESRRAEEARLARTEAEAARQAAERARVRSDRVRRSLVEILRSPDPERDGRNVTVVELLDREVAGILDNVDDDPMVRSEMLRVIGETYLSLGQQAKAVALAEQAEALTRSTRPEDEPYATAARVFLATAKLRSGHFEDALPLCLQNYKHQVELHGQDSKEGFEAKRLLAEAYLGVGDTDKAILLLEDVLQRKRERFGEQDRQSLEAAASLATAFNSAKRFEEAIEVAEDAHGRMVQDLGSDDPLTLRTETVLANAYSFAGRLQKSIGLHQRSLAAKTEKLGPTHVATLESELALALALITAGRTAEAEPHIAHLAKVLVREQDTLGADSALIAKVNFLNGLAQLKMLNMLRGTEVLHALSSVYTSTAYFESNVGRFIQSAFSLPNARMKTLGALTGGGRALQRILINEVPKHENAKEDFER